MQINQQRLIMKIGSLVLGTEIPKDMPSEKWDNLSVVLQFEHIWIWSEHGRTDEANDITQSASKRNGVRRAGHHS